MNKKKEIYLEVLRIISAFFVIFNHTADKGFLLFSRMEPWSFQYWIYLCFSIICKIAVPIFFMISGVLLLGKKESFKKIFLHRILKTVIILFVFSFLYFLIDVFNGSCDFDMVTFFSVFYSAEWNHAFWFLYAYIGFLLLLPILRAIVQNISRRDFYITLILIICFQIIPFLEFFIFDDKITINENINLNVIFRQELIYPCIGYFLAKESKNIITKKNFFIIILTNFICLFIECFSTFYMGQKYGNDFNSYFMQRFLSLFALIHSASIFLIIKRIFEKIKLSEKIIKIILTIGDSCLGIYILHIFILKRLPYAFYFNDLLIKNGVNSMLAIILICVLVMIICSVITIFYKILKGKLIKRK